jgi:hypothetical protein
MLVDTGASTNVVRVDVIKELNLVDLIATSSVKLNTANSELLKVIGKIRLRVEWCDINSMIKKEEIPITREEFLNNINNIYDEIDSDNDNDQMIEFIVVEELSVPILLGVKGIRKMKMIINYKEENIVINGRAYPFLNNAVTEQPIKVLSNYKLPPYSISTIKVSANLIKNLTYSIEDNNSKNVLIELLTNGCYTPKVDGLQCFCVMVRNLSDQFAELYAGDIIGLATEASVFNIQEEKLEDHGLQRNDVTCGEHLSRFQKKQLFKLLKRQDGLFREKLLSKEMQNILPKYAIKLAQDHTPYIAPMARLSPEKEKILENEVQDFVGCCK